MIHEEIISLKYFEKLNDGQKSQKDIFSETEFNSNICLRRWNWMVDQGFIQQINNDFNNPSYVISLSGKREFDRLKTQVISEESDDEKKKWDVRLAKWQAKTFWWVFALGAIGGICGIISLLWQLS